MLFVYLVSQKEHAKLNKHVPVREMDLKPTQVKMLQPSVANLRRVLLQQSAETWRIN